MSWWTPIALLGVLIVFLAWEAWDTRRQRLLTPQSRRAFLIRQSKALPSLDVLEDLIRIVENDPHFVRITTEDDDGN